MSGSGKWLILAINQCWYFSADPADCHAFTQDMSDGLKLEIRQVTTNVTQGETLLPLGNLCQFSLSFLSLPLCFPTLNCTEM